MLDLFQSACYAFRLFGFVLAISGPAVHAQTVFLFSLDGLGHQVFQESQLPTLKRLAAKGAMASGIQPAFPSTTANSHCALWTGAYGDVSHIAANSQPALPRAEHTFWDRNNGYRSDQLAAEPVWVTAARQGIETVAYQPPQAFPFRPVNTHPRALTINGYQTKQVAGHGIFRRKDLVFDSPTTFHFTHGPLTLRGTVNKIGVVIEGIPVRYAPAERELSGDRPLARRFSEGLYLEQPVPSVVYFRLWAFDRGLGDWLLYVSPIQELAMSHGDARPLLREAGGFIGNSYDGPKLDDAQAMETTELQVRQNARQTVWLQKNRKPRFFIGYLPTADEVGHRYVGKFRQGDPAGRRFLPWGFALIERWSREIAALIGRDDHLILTADHGMAPTYKLVNVNEILRRAGLGDRAVHIYNSVLLNTTDFRNGVVTDRKSLLGQVRAALSAVRDPEPVFTGFYTPEEYGTQYGIGGPAGSDLYFDLRPGYSVRDVAGELFPELDEPRGNHGFRPDRDDMLAVLFAVGPRIAKKTQWPRLKSIDVAPLACTLLDIDPPAQSQGKSPLPR